MLLSPRPNRTATGMPWILPEGEVSGVLISPCASNQMTPRLFLYFRTPEIVPIAILWSPPYTNGNLPSLITEKTFSESKELTSDITFRFLRFEFGSVTA